MLFTYPVAGAPDKVIALLVGMVLFVVNEANRVENLGVNNGGQFLGTADT